jgi:hypothetical protein
MIAIKSHLCAAELEHRYKTASEAIANEASRCARHHCFEWLYLTGFVEPATRRTVETSPSSCSKHK